MTDKLKPCPFCGGEAVWWDTGDHKYPYQIVCRSCFCETNETQTRSSAIEAWNTRKPMDRIVEQLEAKAEDCRKYWDEFGDEDEISIMIGYKRAIEIVKGGGSDEC